MQGRGGGGKGVLGVGKSPAYAGSSLLLGYLHRNSQEEGKAALEAEGGISPGEKREFMLYQGGKTHSLAQRHGGGRKQAIRQGGKIRGETAT